MAADDSTLVALSLQDDREAFAQLIARYQTLVCSVAYSITGDFSASEDVGQDVFVAAWSRLSELNDAAKFKSWVCGIARNLAHNALRDSPCRRSVGLTETLRDSLAAPDEAAADAEERELVWRALAELAPLYREPLVLYYRQEQSLAEVAESLEISMDVVKQRLSRGRKLLRVEVAAVVERTLTRTTPTHAFTAVVLAALPAASSKSAAAAVASTSAPTAVLGVIGGGVLGAAIGSLVGLAGGVFGTWRSWRTAEYQSQRDLIVRMTALFSVGFALFCAPFVSLLCGWNPQATFGPQGAKYAHLAWMGIFVTGNAVWIRTVIRQSTEITARERSRGTPTLRNAAS